MLYTSKIELRLRGAECRIVTFLPQLNLLIKRRCAYMASIVWREDHSGTGVRRLHRERTEPPRRRRTPILAERAHLDTIFAIIGPSRSPIHLQLTHHTNVCGVMLHKRTYRVAPTAHVNLANNVVAARWIAWSGLLLDALGRLARAGERGCRLREPERLK
jgi:hypothetical protein